MIRFLSLLVGSRERVADIAYAQNPSFYQGKTIRIIVGSDSGGLYDLWARLFAKHMPKYIPGNPNMIVQNMPGAGGLAATNYLYGMTKADGLTLGMFQAHRYMQQLTGVEEVKFDLRKFNWIGTMEKTEVMFLSVPMPLQIFRRCPEIGRAPSVWRNRFHRWHLLAGKDF